MLAEATIKVRVGAPGGRARGGAAARGAAARDAAARDDGAVMHTASEGDGPVHALDGALRKALLERYPELGRVELVDFKVRVVDQTAGTGATVRVSIESSDGEGAWSTVGSSPNIIEASWLALADSMEYALLRAGRRAERYDNNMTAVR
jgi:hypothetical protein